MGKIAYAGAEAALAGALSGRYLALLTAAPSGPGATISSLSEYSAAGYARVPVAFATAAGTPRTAANSGAVSTSPLTGATGSVTITHWALVTVASGSAGSVIAYGDVTGADRSPEAGEVVTFAAGSITVQID